MNIQEIISQLTEKFGHGSFDVSKVTDFLKGIDLKNLNLTEIVGKIHSAGLLDNVNLDGVKDGLLDSLKSKAGGMLGNLFGK